MELHDASVWPMNGTLTIENSGASHNSYVHRFRLCRLHNLRLWKKGVQIVEAMEAQELAAQQEESV